MGGEMDILDDIRDEMENLRKSGYSTDTIYLDEERFNKIQEDNLFRAGPDEAGDTFMGVDVISAPNVSGIFVIDESVVTPQIIESFSSSRE